MLRQESISCNKIISQRLNTHFRGSVLYETNDWVQIKYLFGSVCSTFFLAMTGGSIGVINYYYINDYARQDQWEDFSLVCLFVFYLFSFFDFELLQYLTFHT